MAHLIDTFDNNESTASLRHAAARSATIFRRLNNLPGESWLDTANRSEGYPAASSADDTTEASDYTTLVHRIGAGDSAAETEFVRQFEPGIRALVRRHARPGDPGIDDFTQAAMQAIIEQLRASALKEPKALLGYIRNAVAFNVRGEYRRRARQLEEHADSQLDVPDDGANPETSAQQDQLASVVRVLLRELKVPRDREILRLHYLLEEDRDVICHTLGIETSHFHRVLFRARERLKELIVATGHNFG